MTAGTFILVGVLLISFSQVLGRCTRRTPLPQGVDRYMSYDDSYGYGYSFICHCEWGTYYTGPANERCNVTCVGDEWKINYECALVTCNSFPTIEKATLMNATGPDIVYHRKDQIQYTCAEGYQMIGSGSLVCEQRERYKNADWVEIDIFYPKCELCREPPVVQNAELQSVSSYTLGSSATYKCNKDFTMLGTGEAECRGVLNSTGEFSRYPTWAFLPHCIPNSCLIPKGKYNQNIAINVGVTRCVSRAASGIPKVTCDPMKKYRLRRGYQDRNMVYYGEEVCMAQTYSREVHEAADPSVSRAWEACHTLCIQQDNGIGELIVTEKHVHNGSEVVVEKMFDRFETLGSGSVNVE